MRRYALLLVLAVAACDPLGPEFDRLQDAEERWARNRPDSYSFVLEWSCLCEYYGGTRIVVEGDSIVSAEPVEEMLGEELPMFTIDDLLAHIRRELDKDPDEATVRFADLGYPTYASFDFDEDSLDDEYGIRIEEFTVLTE